MKILLLGEFSGLHTNLAKGLKKLGEEVVVASNGDRWKNYPRDINFFFEGKYRKFKLTWALVKNFKLLIGYDVVQLINPNFLDAKPFINKLVFLFIKLSNKSIFLGANGNDYFYIKYGLSGNYSKSVFNQKHLLSEEYIKSYIEVPLSNSYKKYNYNIARIAKGITACCAEYELAYKKEFSDKLTFIPLPIDVNKYSFCNNITKNVDTVVFFMGHYKDRQTLKGTDIIEEVLLQLENKYKDEIKLHIVDSIPFDEYQNLFNNSHIVVDQLYSYGCGMNGVLALSKGMVVAGGADPYMYKLFNDNNKPLINLPIDKEKLYAALEKIIINKSNLLSIAHSSREFAIKHHDCVKVAERYLDFWKSKL